MSGPPIDSKKLLELTPLTTTPGNSDIFYVLHYNTQTNSYVDRSVTAVVMLAGINQRVDSVVTLVGTFNTRISTNTNNIASNRSQIIANQQAIIDLSVRMAQAEANIETLFDEISRLDDELDDMRTDITNLSTDVTNLRLDTVVGRRVIPLTNVIDWSLGESWYGTFSTGTHNLTFINVRQGQEISIELSLSGGAIINLPASVTRTFGVKVADTFNVVALKAVQAGTQQHAVWVQEPT